MPFMVLPNLDIIQDTVKSLGRMEGSARSSKMSLSLNEGSTNREESLGCGATASHTMPAAPGITQKGQHYYVVPHKP